MTDITPTQSRPGLLLRSILSIPVIGWIAKDLLYGDKDNIWYLLVAVLSLWAAAVMTWGVVALYLPAVAFVPVMFVILLLITRG